MNAALNYTHLACSVRNNEVKFLNGNATGLKLLFYTQNLADDVIKTENFKVNFSFRCKKFLVEEKVS